MSKRIDWDNAVMAAEITATPAKVIRMRSDGRCTTFWVLEFTINGRSFAAEGDFRFTFTTRKAAVTCTPDAIAQIRDLMTEVGYYFEYVDSPESDLVQAVMA